MFRNHQNKEEGLYFIDDLLIYSDLNLDTIMYCKEFVT